MILSSENQKILKLLKEKSKIELTIISESMIPTLKKGQKLFFEHKKPKIGDIIAIMMLSGDIMVHRYYGLHQGQLLTKGDNNDEFETSPAEWLIGTAGKKACWRAYPSYLKHVLTKWLLKFSLTRNALDNFFLRKISKNPLIDSIAPHKTFFDITFFNCPSQQLLSLENLICFRCPHLEFRFKLNAPQKRSVPQLCGDIAKDPDNLQFQYQLYYQVKERIFRNYPNATDSYSFSQYSLKQLRELLLTPCSTRRQQAIMRVIPTLTSNKDLYD